jgi:hypothetical protein
MSEGLRLQINRKLGLDVTKEQCTETLRAVYQVSFLGALTVEM